MASDRDQMIRVGIRVVVVAVAVGLLVLALSGEALSQELPASVSEAAEMLVSSEPLPADVRVDRAERLLREDRNARRSSIGSALFDLVWTGATSGSPRRVIKSGRRVVREFGRWNRRSLAEDRALELLEGDPVAPVAEGRGRELYERLRSREDEERIDRWIGQAEDALEEGELGTARRRLDWIFALRPDESKLEPLRLRLSERASRSPENDESEPVEEIEDWEAPLAAALLTGDYARVLAFERTRPDVDLAHAAALYLSGDRKASIGRLEKVDERTGRPALLARTWLADERFYPETALARSERRFRVRRTLGWLGGDRLEENGLSPSRKGVDAWQAALSPLNLVVSLPARLLSGRRPESTDIHAAATRYLERVPFGPRAADAKAWLARSSSRGVASRNDRAFVDGHFSLPRAETPFPRLNPPLLITPAGLDALSRDRFARLGIRLETPTPLLLTLVRGEVPSTAIALSRDTALRLAAGLAHGLETGALSPVEGDRAQLLEGLRRIDTSLRRGATLVVDPWLPKTDASTELSRALVDGGSPAQLRQLSVTRSKSSVRVERKLFARSPRCPEATLCIDRSRSYDGRLYARLDDDGDARVGLRGKLARAQLAVEIGRSGPQASIVLPIGHWLGMARWLPAELHLGLGVDGFAASSKLGRPQPSYASAWR